MVDKNLKGYVYCAVGPRYYEECTESILSLKKIDKKHNICVFTDNIKYFNNKFPGIVIKSLKPNYNYSDKIFSILNSPFYYSLFLDTDTVICNKVFQIFDLLAYYDCAIAVETGRSEHWKNIPLGKSVFTEFNTGVFLYKKNKKINLFLKKWLNSYIKRIKIDFHDQTSFAIELIKSTNLRHTILPTNFNFRSPTFQTIDQDLIILHGRHRNNTKIISKINSKNHIRAWDPKRKKIYHKNLTLFQYFIKILNNNIFLNRLVKIFLKNKRWQSNT